MTVLLRWGRSAYETDEALALERRLLEPLGVEVRRHEGPKPPLQGVELLATTSKVRVDEAVLEGASALRMVVTTTSGHEHIDAAAARARGLTVARCPLARRDAVVDTTLAMGLSLLRRLPAFDARAEADVWARGELPALAPRLVRGLVVGVVGVGVIGARVAELWAALGAEVLLCDPRLSDSLSLAELLERAELLTLHCALTPGSDWLIDAEALASMREGAILLNTARGRCVDVQALATAPHLGGVGLDVFPVEPWPALAELKARGDVYVLPHAAGYHPGLGEAVAREVAETVRCFLAGEGVPAEVRPG
ncbi:MAG: hypothetical protein H6741_17065 [Alphaproteobacteria bacterium]|nr:hypothetical protein [Alphaproteobacteria bacterium]MCB9794427.1 hypothetical protein [Alphaproteobacteria bacterium]